MPGIIGVVADLLETPKEYETAVETALGGSIQNIVTDSEATAKNLIGYLKKNKFGRATFLPLTSITARGGFQKKEALKEPGVVGLAHTLVKVKGGYSHLAEYLLGRILVVDQIDHAIAIAKKYQYSLRIVTLEGELLSAGGSMTGGAFKNSSNLLGRKRELEELERAMTAALSQYDQIQLRVKEAEDELKAGREELEAIREQIQKAQVDQSTLEANYRAAEEKAEEIRSGYEEIGKEGKRLAEELEKLEEAKAALSVESESLEKKNRDEESKAGQLEENGPGDEGAAGGPESRAFQGPGGIFHPVPEGQLPAGKHPENRKREGTPSYGAGEPQGRDSGEQRKGSRKEGADPFRAKEDSGAFPGCRRA